MTNRVATRPAIDDLAETVPRLLGQSPAMAAVRTLVELAAATDGAVLIRGETGTGKGLVARRIHATSRGRAGPFVALLCPALPREPTDFHHLFSSARGGDLLLDEVGDMPLGDQDMFLAAMRAHAARPAGVGHARCLATSRADLDALSRLGRFRSELLAALAVVRVDLPPLRLRLADLPELVDAFLEKADRRGVTRANHRPRLTPGALVELGAHAWPGNVLELENVLERVVIAASGEWIDGDSIRAALAIGSVRRTT